LNKPKGWYYLHDRRVSSEEIQPWSHDGRVEQIMKSITAVTVPSPVLF
jgi:hypothetical protein